VKDELGIFQGFFNVKRLQHGTLTGLSNEMAEPVLLHDCSTLGGNSGSAVFDSRED
jgi:V8-like Glu-specific endopeptidase